MHEPLTDPLIGRQLANYRIERLIRRGGMAAVYYAVDVLLGRDAAVKIIDPYSRRPEAYRERMLREARAVAAWRHENIIQVYHAGDEDGTFFFAMEYMDGHNLADIIAAYTCSGELPPHEEVLRYGRAIASALDYAHTRNIIHRDVKPQNVLVAQDGRVVLTDFGLALNIQQGSLGEVFGTAHYTAPEQARRSNAAVAASDLYSLGIMLYEMLVGVVPFDDPSPTSVALQHITLPPPPPRQVNPQLSPAVEAVLLRAIHKDPGSRYASGKELIDALEKALQAQPVLQAELPPLPPPPPPEAPGMAAAMPEAVSLLGAEIAGHGQATPVGATKPTRVPARAAAGAAGKAHAAKPATGPRPAAGKPHAHSEKNRWGRLLSAGIGLGLLLALVGVALIALFGRSGGMPDMTPTSVPALGMSGTAAPLPKPENTATPSIPLPPPVTSTPAGGFPTPPATATFTSQPPTPTHLPVVLGPSATPRYINGRRFILYYNNSSFYMHQKSGNNGRVAPLIFERVNDDSPPSNRFVGELWAQYNKVTISGWCMRIEITSLGNYLLPAECGKNYLASRWPNDQADFIFWTPQPGSSSFRVLWQGEEVARCPIADGTCEVYLP